MIFFIKIIKWIPPYWDNKALPQNFLIIYFIYIENKCFSDVIRNFEKGEKKLCQKADSNPGLLRQNVNNKRVPSAPLELTITYSLLSFWLSQ